MLTDRRGLFHKSISGSSHVRLEKGYALHHLADTRTCVEQQEV